jgi:hypothetical protein
MAVLRLNKQGESEIDFQWLWKFREFFGLRYHLVVIFVTAAPQHRLHFRFVLCAFIRINIKFPERTGWP